MFDVTGTLKVATVHHAERILTAVCHLLKQRLVRRRCTFCFCQSGNLQLRKQQRGTGTEVV